MPSAQVINLNPPQRTTKTPLEQTLGAFATRFNENRQDQQDTDALRDIYGQYQQDGMNIQDAIMKIQTTPGISPTTRVNSVKQLMQMQDYNERRTAVAEKEYRVAEHQRMKEEERRREIEFEESKKAARLENLRKSGANDKEIALYEAAPVGGQTAVVQGIIDRQQRDLGAPTGLPEGLTDYDSFLTPKERVKRQDQRFASQNAMVSKNSESLRALQNEKSSLDLMNSLQETGKLGIGLNKLNINPKTGDLFITQLANAEEQLFAKTVNDFTVKAKDSFGARVTNFELDRFMQRLPTLANSDEGRDLIIHHMSLVNEAQQLERKALQDVFDTYGVRNIDFVEAENLARKTIEKQTDLLREEASQVESRSRKLEEQENKKIKSKVSEGYTAMRGPDGSINEFPNKAIKNLEMKGFKKL